MKFLLLVALIACAYAEPEADAYYRGYYGGHYAPRGYVSSYNYAPYRYTGYTGYGYGSPYTYGYRALHKREAEAEPEADAYYARTYGYTGAYNGLYGYRGYAASPYTYAASPYRYSYGYSRPAYSYGYRALHKRDAEAEPEADAYYARTYGYTGAYNGLYGYRGYAASPYTYAASPYRYSYGYSRPAYSYGYHALHKRDAEAEPEADAYYRSYYNYGVPAYRSYAHGAYRPYRSFYSYGRPSAYTYHH